MNGSLWATLAKCFFSKQLLLVWCAAVSAQENNIKTFRLLRRVCCLLQRKNSFSKDSKQCCKLTMKSTTKCTFQTRQFSTETETGGKDWLVDLVLVTDLGYWNMLLHPRASVYQQLSMIWLHTTMCLHVTSSLSTSLDYVSNTCNRFLE